MEEIIFYKSRDGKIFESEDDCWEHEQDIVNKTTDIRIYRRDRTRIHNLFSETNYSESYRVVIPNESALLDVKQLYRWLGFYDGIDLIGTWYFDDEDNGKWVKRS